MNDNKMIRAIEKEARENPKDFIDLWNTFCNENSIVAENEILDREEVKYYLSRLSKEQAYCVGVRSHETCHLDDDIYFLICERKDKEKTYIISTYETPYLFTGGVSNVRAFIAWLSEETDETAVRFKNKIEMESEKPVEKAEDMLLRRRYEEYQLHWMLDHCHSISELIQLAREEDGLANGFNGELWASFNEWKSNELAEEDEDEGSDKYFATNIEYFIDDEDIRSLVDDVFMRGNEDMEFLADQLDVPQCSLRNMSKGEIFDLIKSGIRHNFVNPNELLGLRDEIELDEDLGICVSYEDWESITNYLSDETGYFIEHYNVEVEVNVDGDLIRIPMDGRSSVEPVAEAEDLLDFDLGELLMDETVEAQNKGDAIGLALDVKKEGEHSFKNIYLGVCTFIDRAKYGEYGYDMVPYLMKKYRGIGLQKDFIQESLDYMFEHMGAKIPVYVDLRGEEESLHEFYAQLGFEDCPSGNKMVLNKDHELQDIPY